MRIKSILIFLFLTLTSCGYHLRGSNNIDLPAGMENIYLDNGSPQLEKELRIALRSSQGKLVDSISDAGIIIKVLKEDMTTRTMSLSDTGKAIEFELGYKLLFSLYDNQGKELLSNQKIQIKRDYFNDQVDILGMTNEEQTIRSEMCRQAVGSIVTKARVAMEAKAK